VEGDAYDGAVGLLDVEPDAKGHHVVPIDQDGTDILMPPDVGVSRRVFHLGNRVHRLALFGWLGVINDHIEGLPLAGTEGAQQFLGFLAEGRFGIPPLHQEKIVEAGPVVLDLQVTVQVGHIPSAPHTGHREDQQAEVHPVVPVKVRSEGTKKLVQDSGNPYDAEHEAILLSPMVNGRLYTLPSRGPRMASPPAAVKPLCHFPPKKSVNVSNINR
jgi:hypothetical protein